MSASAEEVAGRAMIMSDRNHTAVGMRKPLTHALLWFGGAAIALWDSLRWLRYLPLVGRDKGVRIALLVYFAITAVPLVFAAIFAVRNVRLAFRQWRMSRYAHLENACPQCGYDIRYSSGRCPECGGDLLREEDKDRRADGPKA